MSSHARRLTGIAASSLLVWSATASAVTFEAGDWSFSANGYLSVNYTNTQCDDSAAVVDGSLLCAVGPGEEDSASSVNSGNLPAGIVLGAHTNQNGLEIGAKFGFYPGIVSNDFGSGSGPNLPPLGRNSALSSTSLDIRQVYGTIGSDSFGTIKVGRDYLTVGLDAILNDITLISVGVASVATARSPKNTSLGSIGFGHLFPTPQAQITYSTPDFGGLSGSIGIFQPIDAISASGTGAGSAGSVKDMPGFHGKIGYTGSSGELSYKFSAAALMQDHELQGIPGVTGTQSGDSQVFDVFAQMGIGPFSAFAYYYTGEGVGIYSYFIDGFAANGEERDSDGALFQLTYTLGNTKFGANYGYSDLDQTAGDPGTLLESNTATTFGVYHTLTPNVTLTAEYTTATAENNTGGEVETDNINAGFFISF
ncbi:hypothetical protein RM531_14185 [Salinisphaera sp. P385]|uniref:Porin n=1 Tax=Spectribacter acetivorans TaxID=3075603 RepID=A0ABU3BBW7_9GAMM|nr:porin [Salinisphaera sp. P385]MDT0619623.1 hypothetical protein [Salinisphaera sp. P385]